MWRHLIKLRKRLFAGSGRAVIGAFLWIAAMALHVTPPQHRDQSITHIEARLLSIATGGAPIATGIILIAAD